VNPGILYISYDGMLEPLGQSQVVAYLERLAIIRRIHLISFEKSVDWSDEDRREAMSARLAQSGIAWHPLRYHKSPSAPATAYDIAAGSVRAIALVRRHRLGIVHARSYIAAAIALAVKKVMGTAFLFDMRGFWADERVDGGVWPAGSILFRAAKEMERHFLLVADQVVTLTHASKAKIESFDFLAGRVPPITVIPTCADLDRFTIQGPPPEAFTLGYVGSVGTWYLLDEMLRCFRIAAQEEPAARLLFVNRNEHELICNRADAMGVDPASIEITASEHWDVPTLIGKMTAGMALYKPSFSRVACAPTKLAEYLGCGVPCLGSSGVGDTESILEKHRVGVTLQGFSEPELRQGVRRLIALSAEPGLQQRCHQTAVELFSLERGAEAYDAIYRRLHP
jgi:glycosyltransferase involved in cell wall biosynthesis